MNSVTYSGVFLLQIAPISSEDREAFAFRSGSIPPSPIKLRAMATEGFFNNALPFRS
jgi:hypothetical protein